MTALALGSAWAALALVGLARHRPPPRRARALTRARELTADPVSPRATPDPLAAVGRLVLPAAPRGRRGRLRHAGGTGAGGSDSGTGRARVAGATTIAVCVSFALAPALAPVAVAAGWAVPRHRARAAERRRLQALEAGLAELVDLLVLAVEAGCNVTLALAAAGRRAGGPLAPHIRRVCAEVAGGRRLADALDELPATAGEPVRPLAAVLAASERYGTPVLAALQRLAEEVRLQRRRRAEAAARRVPVALLFPLVLCILPAFALLTVAPLVAGALRELRL